MALAIVADFGAVPAPARGVLLEGALDERTSRRDIAPRRQILVPATQFVGVGATPAADRHLPPPPEGSGRGGAVDLLA